MNLWIAGAVLAASTLVVVSLPAYDRGFRTQDSQSVFLRLESRNDAEVVSEFQRRLQDYDGVRRRLDATLPAAALSDDPATIRHVVDAHHGALLAARFKARQGDIFSSAIAETFRSRIRESLHGMSPRQFLASITEADAPPIGRPSINASYPDGAALTTMPPDLLQRLPSLPAGLEYRFIDRDLILWDPHANLIVDFIPNALASGDER